MHRFAVGLSFCIVLAFAILIVLATPGCGLGDAAGRGPSPVTGTGQAGSPRADAGVGLDRNAWGGLS